MKKQINSPGVLKSMGFLIPLFILALAVMAGGCKPQEQNPPTQTSLPASPSSTPLPALTATPTLELLDDGVVYTVVGLYPDRTLPIYNQPSLSAGITGYIPATAKSIRTTGMETEADDISWLQIVYQESAGWVDSTYIARQYGDVPDELVEMAQSIAAVLKDSDYIRLAEIVHPELCLRFSPYPYLHDSDLEFCPDALAGLPGSTTIYTWGRYDGSGEPIGLSFDEYHQRFVYDQNFYQPEVVGLNQEVSSGNAINNIPEIFPDGMIVEYHFSGFDPQYGGMDWRSLRMVFVQEKGGWFLVALVHGEWTI